MRNSPQRLALILGVLGLCGMYALALAADPETAPGWDANEIAIADSLFRAGEARQAHARLSAAIATARSQNDQPALGRLLYQRGARLTYQGQPRLAQGALEEAIPVCLSAGDTLTASSAVIYLNWSLTSQGRLDESRAHLARYTPFLERHGNDTHLAWVHVGLGYIALLEGKFDDSRAEYAKAIGLRPDDAAVRVTALIGHGRALHDLGDIRGARSNWEEAAALARTSGLSVDEAHTINNLGNLELSVGDPARAEAAFRRAIELHRASGNLREQIPAARGLANAMMNMRRFAEVSSLLDSLVEVTRREGLIDLEADVIETRGELGLMSGDPAAAADDFRDVLSMGRSAPVQFRVDASYGLARALQEQDSLEAALRVIGEADDLKLAPLPSRARLQRLHAALLIDMGRFREGRDAAAAADAELKDAELRTPRLGVLAQLARAELSLGRPDRARRSVEAGLDIWEGHRLRSTDLYWREALATAGDLHVRGAQVVLADSRERESTRTRAAFDLLQRFKSRTLLERIHGAATADEAPAADPATVAELQDVLVEDELFVDFHAGSDTGFVFFVTREACTVRALPHVKTLERLVELQRAIQSAHGDRQDPTVIRRANAAARQLLFGDEALVQGHRRVFLSPDGPLHHLPLEVLIWDEGAREMVRLPNATVLTRLRHEERVRSPAIRIAAVAGRGQMGDDVLGGAEAEVRGLASRFRDVSILPSIDPDVRIESDILHVAAHAEGDADRPWRSGIRVSPAEPDGYLRADQVLDMDVPSDVVVLSSCETAVGVIPGTESVTGLATAFLAAGCRTVVATLWPVEDRAARRFTRAFYDALADGRTAAAAVAEARIRLAGHPSTSSPRTWGAFVLLGDPDVSGHLERKSNALWYLGLAVPVILLAGVIVTRRRRGALQERRTV